MLTNLIHRMVVTNNPACNAVLVITLIAIAGIMLFLGVVILTLMDLIFDSLKRLTQRYDSTRNYLRVEDYRGYTKEDTEPHE